MLVASIDVQAPRGLFLSLVLVISVNKHAPTWQLPKAELPTSTPAILLFSDFISFVGSASQDTGLPSPLLV